MAQVAVVDYILSDCFLAVGQAVGPDKTVDLDAVIWSHQRYRCAFDYAMETAGTSWVADRNRVTAVGRYLGQRVVEYTGRRTNIDCAAARRASSEVEGGCQMSAAYDAFRPAGCTDSTITTFPSREVAPGFRHDGAKPRRHR